VGETAGRSRGIAVRADRRVENITASFKLERLRRRWAYANRTQRNSEANKAPSTQHHTEVPPLLAQESERWGC
jgi:hypothetical protein